MRYKGLGNNEAGKGQNPGRPSKTANKSNKEKNRNLKFNNQAEGQWAGQAGRNRFMNR